MKYYLIPDRCPKCGKGFFMLLRLDKPTYHGVTIPIASAVGVHCKTRWVLKLDEQQVKKVVQE